MIVVVVVVIFYLNREVSSAILLVFLRALTNKHDKLNRNIKIMVYTSSL